MHIMPNEQLNQTGHTAPELHTAEPAELRRFRCRHIFHEGRRCGSPAIKQKDFCYYHLTLHTPVHPEPACEDRFGAPMPTYHDLPMPEDRAAIQTSLGIVLRALATNSIKEKRAAILIYGLQVASANLPPQARLRAPELAPGTPAPLPHTSSLPSQPPILDDILYDITYHRDHGPIAPVAELPPDPTPQPQPTVIDPPVILSEAQNLRRSTSVPTLTPIPGTLPTLQATAAGQTPDDPTARKTPKTLLCLPKTPSCLRARLQPCRNSPQIACALAPEVTPSYTNPVRPIHTPTRAPSIASGCPVHRLLSPMSETPTHASHSAPQPHPTVILSEAQNLRICTSALHVPQSTPLPRTHFLRLSPKSRGGGGYLTQLRALTQTALLLLTLTTLRAQDFSQAETRPDPSAALTQQANDALAAGNYPAALKLLTQLNTQTPNSAEVLFNLGLTTESLAETPSPQLTTGNPQPATPESFYRQSIAANPLFAPSHVALGLLLARTNHPAEARTELLAATALTAAEPVLRARAYRALAHLDLNAHSTQSASADLLAALALSPEAPDDILLSAQIAQAIPDLPVAEQAYRRYLALNPDAPDAPATTASLAHVLLAQHHPAEAEALLTPALAAHPADPTLTAELAATYLASDDPTKIAHATPLLESLHAAHPEDSNAPTITRLLARVYLETNHPDQADPLYAALISAASQNGNHPDPTLLTARAEALIRLHRPGEAESLLKQATANPAAFPTPNDYADALTHLAFAAAEIDDPKVALQALQLRSTVLPPTPSSLFLEATANDTLHQSAKAADLYRQFLAAAHGDFPQQEVQARKRLAALNQKK